MTVEGATQFAMPPFLLRWIVERMNENREKKLVVHLQRKFGDFEVRQKQKVAVVENTSTQQTTTTQPKKGLPGFALTATPPPPKRPRQNRVIMANVRRDGNKVKRAARALHAEFTEQEFRKFIAVLLYTYSNQVKNLKDYWVKNPVTKSNHPLVRMLFSRDRFVSLYGCFRFEDEDLEKMDLCRIGSKRFGSQQQQQSLMKHWWPQRVEKILIMYSLCGGPTHMGSRSGHSLTCLVILSLSRCSEETGLL